MWLRRLQLETKVLGAARWASRKKKEEDEQCKCKGMLTARPSAILRISLVQKHKKTNARFSLGHTGSLSFPSSLFSFLCHLLARTRLEQKCQSSRVCRWEIVLVKEICVVARSEYEHAKAVASKVLCRFVVSAMMRSAWCSVLVVGTVFGRAKMPCLAFVVSRVITERPVGCPGLDLVL